MPSLSAKELSPLIREKKNDVRIADRALMSATKASNRLKKELADLEARHAKATTREAVKAAKVKPAVKAKQEVKAKPAVKAKKAAKAK